MKMSYDSTHAGKHRYTLYLDKANLILAGKLETHSKLLRTGLMGGNAASLNLFITNLLGALKLVNTKVSGHVVNIFHSASIPGVQDITCQVAITPSCLGDHLVNITIHSNLYQVSDLEHVVNVGTFLHRVISDAVSCEDLPYRVHDNVTVEILTARYHLIGSAAFFKPLLLTNVPLRIFDSDTGAIWKVNPRYLAGNPQNINSAFTLLPHTLTTEKLGAIYEPV